MVDVPNDYDPRGRGLKRHPTRERLVAARKVRIENAAEEAAEVWTAPVFGRREPPEPEDMMPPICGHSCRLGDCADHCRLMARTDKKEPRWTTPKK